MSGNVPTEVPEDKGSTCGALPLPSEVDGGNKQYRLYTMTLSNGNKLAEFAVFNHNTSSTNDANFEKGKVYWYVNTGYLGDLCSQDLSISISFVDRPLGDRFSPPKAGQKFEREDGDSWTQISSKGRHHDPLANQGFLYRGTDHSGHMVYIRFVKVSDKSELMKIAWYQLLPESASPTRVAPNGKFCRLTENCAVTAPQGQSAYCSLESAS